MEASKTKYFDHREIIFRASWRVVFVTLVLCIYCLTAGKISATAAFDTNEHRAFKNRAAIALAEAGIEKYRMRSVHIKVVDSHGRAVSDARLEVKQVTHAFKFGCYLKMDDLETGQLPNYEREYAALFNYAVIGTYWDATENKRGDENWLWFDREAELAKKLGLRTQAAPVLWGTNKYGTPAWLPRNKDELSHVLEERVKSVVSRNPGIDDWEIVNEPLAPKNDVFATIGTGEYISAAFLRAKEAAPKGRFILNEYGIFGSIGEHNYNRDRYFELAQRLIENGVPIDVIGIQAHANGEWYEPANVAEQLERYALLGKPVQITEFSAQTLDYDDRKTPLAITGNYRSGVWDEAKQAEFYREFYTVAFGNPQVEAITTWGLDDGRAWLPGIGLIDKNGRQKAAYRELDRLINSEWKTRINARSDNDGKYDLRGFFGNYEVTATTRSGKVVRSRFVLAQGSSNDWVMRTGI